MSTLTLTDLTEAVAEAARNTAIDEYEVYASRTTGVTLTVGGGGLQTVRTERTNGVGLRVFSRKRLGYAYSSVLDLASLRGVAREAEANAQANEPDEFNGVPESEDLPVRMDWLDAPEAAGVPLADKIRLAASAEATARAIPMISRVVNSQYADVRQEICLLNSRGRWVAYSVTAAYLFIELVAQRGDEASTGVKLSWARSPQGLDPVATGREAAERAARLLGGRRPRSGRMSLVLASEVVTRLLTHLVRMVTGEAVQKGRSPLGERLHTLVAAPAVSIIDDPTSAIGPRSRPFDAEGVRSRVTPVITNGLLTGLLHNSYTARRARTDSTSSAYRSSYRMTPEVGSSNFIMAPGSVSQADLIQQLGDGLFVVDLQGAHVISPVTGRFSVGGAGFQVEGGTLAYPVRGFAISGRLTDLLRNAVMISNDLQFQVEPQAVAAPSVLVEGLEIAA